MEGYDLDYVTIGRFFSSALLGLGTGGVVYTLFVLLCAGIRLRTAVTDIARDLLDGLGAGRAEVVSRNVERNESAVLKLPGVGTIRFGPEGRVAAYLVGEPAVNVRPQLKGRERRRIDRAATAALRSAVLSRKA